MFAELLPTPGATPPADTLKNWLECLLYIVGVIMALVYLVKLIHGPKAQPSNELLGQQVEASKHNHTHPDYERRIGDLEKDKTACWNMMRAENIAIRKENTDHYEAISRALGRIEGKLDK